MLVGYTMNEQSHSTLLSSKLIRYSLTILLVASLFVLIGVVRTECSDIGTAQVALSIAMV